MYVFKQESKKIFYSIVINSKLQFLIGFDLKVYSSNKPQQLNR